MSNSNGLSDSLIELAKEKVEFTVDTDREGKLEFGSFKVWRDKALRDAVNNIENMDNEIFAKNVMKFSLYRYKNITIDYDYNYDKSIFNDIELEVSKKEIIEFAVKFLENNDSLLYEAYSEIINKKDADNDIKGFMERANKNRKPLFDFPEDPLEKLKQAFLCLYKRQQRLAETVLGLKIPKKFSYASSLMHQHNKMAEIFNSKDNYNGIDFGIKPIKNLSEEKVVYHQPKSNIKIQDILEQESKHKAKLNSSILRTPDLMEIIIENQKIIGENINNQVEKIILTQEAISENNNIQLRASNEILQEKLDLEKENINSSNVKANVALWISIGSLILTTIIGGYQIYDSSKTSLKNFEKYDMIIDSIKNGNDIYKEQLDATNKLIDELLKDNTILKNKVDELEDKLNSNN